MPALYLVYVILSLVVTAHATFFDPLHHLGGNGPWFAGPNVFEIDPSPPPGCHIDQVAFLSRHGARYPDVSAYDQWTNLSAKIHAANFTTLAPVFAFLHTWKPVLRSPSAEIAQISLGGYKELYDMGVNYRWAYPDLYTYNTPFTLFANKYHAYQPRVIDSARLFARGYLGPNATTLGKVHVINSNDPRSVANSLSPSDLCATYSDDTSGPPEMQWADIYLPPIAQRINSLLSGDLQFTSDDVSIFPYLCGFESQITGRRSPWCDTLLADEVLDYEYAQDLRYWYGDGLGSTVGKGMMLPFLTALVQHLVNGPNTTYPQHNNTTPFHPPPLIALFSNDGPLNQLAAAIGVFDAQPPLPSNYRPDLRLFRASHFVTMRGTITFERLRCDVQRDAFLRVKLNDAVYPVDGCADGPGQSCALSEYQQIIREKSNAFGDFEVVCDIANTSVVPVGKDKTTFLGDLGLPFEYTVAP